MVDSTERDRLPCTPEDAKPVCFPAEVSSHQKFTLEGTLLQPYMKQQFEVLCKEV